METQDSIEPLRLKGIKQLLQESWEIYRSKIKTLLGIAVIPVVFAFYKEIWTFFYNIFKGEHYLFIFFFISVFIVAYIFPLISLFLSFLTSSSLIFAVKEDVGIKKAYKKSLKILVSYFWLSVLLSLFFLGGFIFLIIPGIVFLIWFGFASFVLIDEEKKGMDALLRSKFLVSGNFWGVLQRFLVLFVFVIIIFFLSFFMIKGGSINAVSFKMVNSVLWLFISPFFMIYNFLIYKNLKEINAKIPYKKPSIL